MRQELLDRLRQVTPEEQALLDGVGNIRRELYTSRKEFVVDSRKLLEKGRLIEIRPHTRFVHFPCHRHNYVELVYMCSGSTTHIIDRTETVTLREGDLLFLSQNACHEILPARRDDVAVNFIILPEFFHRPLSMIERENVLRDFLVSTLSGESGGYLHIPAKGIVSVENLMESMIWTILEQRSGINTIIQTSIGLLLMNLSRFAGSIDCAAPGQEEQRTVFDVLQYIEGHYRTGSLAEVSSQLHCPGYQISRLLKKHTGCNFKELLGRRKLQQAAYLLSNTPLPVDAVIVSVGYHNSSYFYHRFRERYGCSPVEFREVNGERRPQL